MDKKLFRMCKEPVRHWDNGVYVAPKYVGVYYEKEINDFIHCSSDTYGDLPEGFQGFEVRKFVRVHKGYSDGIRDEEGDLYKPLFKHSGVVTKEYSLLSKFLKKLGI